MSGPAHKAASAVGRPRLLDIVFERGIVRRAAFTGLIVGTILNLIAQGDFLVRGEALDWFKIALTYCVPYCVATYGAVSARVEQYRRGDWQ
jgi:hypothetical protein